MNGLTWTISCVLDSTPSTPSGKYLSPTIDVAWTVYVRDNCDNIKVTPIKMDYVLEIDPYRNVWESPTAYNDDWKLLLPTPTFDLEYCDPDATPNDSDENANAVEWDFTMILLKNLMLESGPDQSTPTAYPTAVTGAFGTTAAPTAGMHFVDFDPFAGSPPATAADYAPFIKTDGATYILGDYVFEVDFCLPKHANAIWTDKTEICSDPVKIYVTIADPCEESAIVLDPFDPSVFADGASNTMFKG
jgi:hypothetical protein